MDFIDPRSRDVLHGVMDQEHPLTLPKDKIWALTELKPFADNKFDIVKMLILLFDREKRRKSWSPALIFLLFP